MKNKILPTCLQGNYGDSLGELSKMSYGIAGAKNVQYNLSIFTWHDDMQNWYCVAQIIKTK